jgi:hypothetical protein
MTAQKMHMYKTVICCSSVEQNVNTVLLRGDYGSLYRYINKLFWKKLYDFFCI